MPTYTEMHLGRMAEIVYVQCKDITAVCFSSFLFGFCLGSVSVCCCILTSHYPFIIKQVVFITMPLKLMCANGLCYETLPQVAETETLILNKDKQLKADEVHILCINPLF